MILASGAIPTASAQTADAVESVEYADPTESVTVNWGEEMAEGGATMIALGVLSLALVAICIERLWFLRRKRFIPQALWPKVDRLVGAYEFESAIRMCRSSKTPFGDGLEVMIERRNSDSNAAFGLAGDIALRRMDAEERRCAPLAVIAGLAPLLGLLGTMIGMIEAFKLVEVFGDEGGAALLAGSISKALITTAAGLVIAVPALIAFHAAKYRIGVMSDDLEGALERAQGQWVLSGDAPLLAEQRAAAAQQYEEYHAVQAAQPSSEES
jgi:biopolymer transport protein ExbB